MYGCRAKIMSAFVHVPAPQPVRLGSNDTYAQERTLTALKSSTFHNIFDFVCLLVVCVNVFVAKKFPQIDGDFPPSVRLWQWSEDGEASASIFTRGRVGIVLMVMKRRKHHTSPALLSSNVIQCPVARS